MINVMIVEDDPMVARLNSKYLEKLSGFRLVGVAKSCREALERLGRDKVDLLLLDIYLPGSNGIELLKDIRKADRNVDVIILSAASDVPTIKKAMNFGAFDYLIKPFEFERFTKSLLSYKEATHYIYAKNKLNQSELDSHYFGRNLEEINTLPKGLNKNTLIKIWGGVVRQGKRRFTTEQIASLIGLSRVSTRKYLEFLKDINMLSLDVEYGTVGRPIYQYRCIGSSSSLPVRLDPIPK